MDFVFLMMKGTEILAVDIVDIEGQNMTTLQAALQLADEIEDITGKRPSAFAVLANSDESVWLLQAVTKVPARKEVDHEN